MIEHDGINMTSTWRMRIAYWITKATGTFSEHVLRIAFPRQHWFCERASILGLYVD